MFTGQYEKKYFHWVGKSQRQNTKKFFTQEQENGLGFQFKEEFYDLNESIFFLLIHSSFKDPKLLKFNIEATPFNKIMREVFSKPNRNNLKKFF